MNLRNFIYEIDNHVKSNFPEVSNERPIPRDTLQFKYLNMQYPENEAFLRAFYNFSKDNDPEYDAIFAEQIRKLEEAASAQTPF